jgi:hypothetical protein
MAHYAFLDENSVVVQVIVGKDEDDIYNWEIIYGREMGLVCKRTSYNTAGGIHTNGGTPFRKNYAGIGFTYDANRDAFIPPQPFTSWVLNENTCLWDPPIPYPSDDSLYFWDESSISWLPARA